MLLASFKKDKLAVATVNCYTKFLASNIDKSLFLGGWWCTVNECTHYFYFPTFF